MKRLNVQLDSDLTFMEEGADKLLTQQSEVVAAAYLHLQLCSVPQERDNSL